MTTQKNVTNIEFILDEKKIEEFHIAMVNNPIDMGEFLLDRIQMVNEWLNDEQKEKLKSLMEGYL